MAKDVLWAQLQEMQRKEMDAVRLERERLDEEKRFMSAHNFDSTDIISINVGGEVFLQAHRDTLCLASGSMFANIFSGRWEGSCARDDQGRVFLDHDPEFIRWIVHHLRIKKTEDPSRPVAAPLIPADKRPAFHSLLHYFGLFAFFYPEGPLFQDLHIVANPENLETSRQHSGGFHLSCKGNQRAIGAYDYNSVFAFCKPALSTDTQWFWKCTVSWMNGDITMGVISNPNAIQGPNDPTCFAWANENKAFIAGSVTKNLDDWTSFSEGETLWFRLAGRRLTMFSRTKNRVFSIDGVAENPYIFFFFGESVRSAPLGSGTKVVLAPLDASEHSNIVW